MYDKTAAHGTLAAAGTLPFTGLSLMWILVVAVIALLAGTMAHLYLHRSKAESIEA